jgi:transcriptional regulator with XRE-family HTH domain
VIRNAGLGEFLRSRRARLDPGQAGLIAAAGRRVPGLRREELARLAGVSKDYYTRLEQGRQAAPSGAVLEALAAALQLDGAERLHLYGLARTAAAPVGKAGQGVQAVRPATYRLMELLAEAPAILLGRRTDILAVNDAARAVFTNFSALPARERNAARCILLDPDARRVHGQEWETVATQMTGILRLDAGRYPGDPRTAELVAELSHSPLFRRVWTGHTVATREPARTTLYHPATGTLEVMVEVMTVPDAWEQTLHILMPALGSPAGPKIRELVQQMHAEGRHDRAT